MEEAPNPGKTGKRGFLFDMWNLKQWIRDIGRLDEKKIFFNVVKDNEVKEFILDLNKLEQLFKQGKDANEDIIGVYSQFTEEVNRGKTFSFKGTVKTKKAGEPIFLFDTGEFYSSFTVVIRKDGIFITANEILDDGRSLTEMFGDGIVGLNEESLTKLAHGILSKYIKETRSQIDKILS